jgi:hypothetical protein
MATDSIDNFFRLKDHRLSIFRICMSHTTTCAVSILKFAGRQKLAAFATANRSIGTRCANTVYSHMIQRSSEDFGVFSGSLLMDFSRILDLTVLLWITWFVLALVPIFTTPFVLT